MNKYTITSPNSPEEWEDYYYCRWLTLRAPWGKPPGSEKDDKEQEGQHFQLIDEQGCVLAVLRLDFISLQQAQMRYMGVLETERGKGLGKMLMSYVEQVATEQGTSEIILQARDYAIPFYESCGYELVEKTFLLWGEIQHYLMRKEIRPL